MLSTPARDRRAPDQLEVIYVGRLPPRFARYLAMRRYDGLMWWVKPEMSKFLWYTPDPAGPPAAESNMSAPVDLNAASTLNAIANVVPAGGDSGASVAPPPTASRTASDSDSQNGQVEGAARPQERNQRDEERKERVDAALAGAAAGDDTIALTRSADTHDAHISLGVALQATRADGDSSEKAIMKKMNLVDIYLTRFLKRLLAGSNQLNTHTTRSTIADRS